MFVYEKKLQYPVRITNPNPRLAALIISQYGGPNGKKIRKSQHAHKSSLPQCPQRCAGSLTFSPYR